MKIAAPSACLAMLLLLAPSCMLRPHDPAADERPLQEVEARQGDAERGKAVAERWCQACHVVAPGRPTLADQARAPSFTALAADPTKDAAHLRRFLDEVHPPMPTYRLFPEEKQDLLAYLAALRPRR